MITGLNHITLAVTDLERSFAFYCDVLQFKPLCHWHKGAYFLAGDLWFCLNSDDKRVPASDYTHYAFTVSEMDFPLIEERILQSGAVIFQENKSPGRSLYFLDPDGHKLEIHAGTWRDRIEHMKQHGSKAVFFE
ncbi:MAG: fosA [Alphaproteobacteria bacterium]|nr:fosA [Alphaproteobacteria bacterium]